MRLSPEVLATLKQVVPCLTARVSYAQLQSRLTKVALSPYSHHTRQCDKHSPRGPCSMVVHHYTPRGELGSTVVYSTVVARTVHCDPAATLNAPRTAH